jgi:hypothetical protein
MTWLPRVKDAGLALPGRTIATSPAEASLVTLARRLPKTIWQARPAGAAADIWAVKGANMGAHNTRVGRAIVAGIPRGVVHWPNRSDPPGLLISPPHLFPP